MQINFQEQNQLKFLLHDICLHICYGVPQKTTLHRPLNKSIK